MMTFVITENGLSPRLAVSKLNDINRLTVQEMGEHWQSEFNPKHFTHRGASEYSYTPRSSRYEMRKLKTKGHTYPLVFSGGSREQAKRARIVTAATKGNADVRVVLNVPTLNLKPRGGRIDLRDEMTRVSSGEARELGNVATDSQERQYNALNETTTRTIG